MDSTRRAGQAVLATPAAAAPSTQCPSRFGPYDPAKQADAQRAGMLLRDSGAGPAEIPQAVGTEQYADVGLDNTHGTWFVGYAPGPLDEAAVRDRVLEVVGRHNSAEDAAWLRDHLMLDPQRYSDADLADVQRRLTAVADHGRWGASWTAGVSCEHGDVKRVELQLYRDDSTPEQEATARSDAAPYGDKAIVVVIPGGGPRADTGPVCALVTPARPPAEGQAGFVSAGQECRAGERVEDFDVVTDFGDGTRAAPPFRADGLWLAGGEHAYRRAGRYLVVSAVTDRRTGVTRFVSRQIEIANAPLRRRRVARPRFPAGRAARRVVAAFADGNPLATAADHRATVRWGDGQRSTGRLRRVAPGRFVVVARHRYAAGSRARRLRVRVADDRGATLRITTRLARAR
ncbi:MAG TPA: hypothetical protein VF533_19225 [Solirubrobacteraceae bacterium]